MTRFLKKLKEKLSTADPNENKKAHASVQPDSPPLPNGPPPSPRPRTSIKPVTEPMPLQARLWNDAYELLKSSNAELVDSYEQILSREFLRGQHAISEPASQDNRIDATYGGRWKQMHTIVNAAMKRQEERVAKQQKIAGGMAAVSTAMRQAVRAVLEAAIAWTGVCFAFEMASNALQEAKANHKGMSYVVSRMDWYWHLAQLLLDGNKSESAPSELRAEMEKHIIDLYERLLLYQMKSVCRFYRQYGSALWRDTIKANDWIGQLDEIRSAEAIIREDSRVFNALETQRRLDDIDRSNQVLQHEIQGMWPQIQEHVLSKEAERCLQDLRLTDPRDDKSRIEDTNGGLLQGAYDWAIKHNDFIAWRDAEENRLLWIRGDPGKGKTMLFCGIIDELQNRGVKPCYFFCQATDPRLNNATAVLRGLIYLLMVTNRQLLSLIQERYDRAGTALFRDANSWIVLSQLFAELLENPSLDGQVFMIDALDECQTDLERLLDLIIGKSANHHVKWIVSSRNWTAIEAKLGEVSQRIQFSLELNEQSVSDAVSVYIRHKAAQLGVAKGLDMEMEQKVRSYLADNARGTFLWVALVCKELLKMGVRKRHLLRKMTEFPSDLEPLYERMMQHIRESEDSDLCGKILRLVAVVYRPVTLVELASLLGLEDGIRGEDLEEIVVSCGSFLVVRDNVVRFVHQSARDFLLKDKTFTSGIGMQHYSLFSRSLDILTTTLRRDMYNLRHPGALIEEHTPSHEDDVLKHAKYSCIYWVAHLRAANDLEQEKCILSLHDGGIVHHFLAKKLLNWLEACSLIGRTPDAARAVEILKRLAPVDDCIMRSLIEDVYRFVLYYKVGIALAPLQVYSSALIFSPQSSLVRLLYEETEGPNWVIQKPDMNSGWKARLHFLEGTTGTVIALAFTPDGTQLASGSSDGTARVWDTETGTCIRTFSCHDHVLDMAYSPDGKYLAIGSYAGVEVRDAISFTNLFMFHHECDFTRITFSRDSVQLAAAFYSLKLGNYIRTWNVDRGTELTTHNLRTHSCSVTAIAPDGRHLAFMADQNGTHYIWNLTADMLTLVLDSGGIEQSLAFWKARFSLDASRLAVATMGCIGIFDASTGECLQKLQERPFLDGSFRFLADSQGLMSVSEDTSLKIWDTTTGTCLRQLSRDATPVVRVAVPSPDGMLIAETKQGFRCFGTELWDMAAAQSNSSLEGSAEEVTAIALSPDGAQMATASTSKTEGKMIRIRDSLTGVCLTKFPWSGTCIDSLAFLLDNKRLASGGKDHIQIWDIAAGLSVQTIEFEAWHYETICRLSTKPIAISSKGDLVAANFGHSPRVVMWDLTSGKISQLFDLERDLTAECPVAAAFSPDDARLELMSNMGTVYICDVKTGGVKIFKHFFEPLDIYQPSPLQLRDELQFLKSQNEANEQPLIHAQPRIFNPSGFKISHDRLWLLKGQKRVLWLPPDYRPSTIVSHEGSVTIRSLDDSQALFFRFANDELETVLT